MKGDFFEIMPNGSLKLNIKARPNSSVLKFGEVLKESGEIKIYLTEIPEGSKANKQLIVFLAKFFKTSKSCVTIEKGETSSNKKVIIQNFSEEALEKIT